MAQKYCQGSSSLGFEIQPYILGDQGFVATLGLAEVLRCGSMCLSKIHVWVSLLIHLLFKCTVLWLPCLGKCIKVSKRKRETEVGHQPMQVCTTEVSYFMHDLTKGVTWEYIFAAMYLCKCMCAHVFNTEYQ